MENFDDSVQHFNETGNLKTGTYYFVPALDEYEMRLLHNLFQYGVKNSIRILNPINSEDLSGERNLLWFEVPDYNKIIGWQNVDETDDDGDSYTLKDLTSIKRFCRNNGLCTKPFRNGRDFLKAYDLEVDSDDFFNQLNESEEENSFDWLDSDELTGFDLKNILNLHFEKRNEPYRVEFDDRNSVFDIFDDTGLYDSYDHNNFTLNEIRDNLMDSLARMKSHTPDSTTYDEYKALYNSLIQFF